MDYPDYFRSEKCYKYIENGMKTYQKGKRKGDANTMIVGVVSLLAGGGSPEQASPPSEFLWNQMSEEEQEKAMNIVTGAQMNLAKMLRG